MFPFRIPGEVPEGFRINSGKMPVALLKGTDFESAELHLIGDAVQRGVAGDGRRDGDPRGNGA